MAQHSADRINRILGLIGGSSYLEVGVASGETFKRVRAESKVAVDPNFKFDTTELSGTGIAFFECTSDEFFADHIDSQFDLIFLDGLHTFEQTLRDLICALNIVSEKGLIIIDDVFPEDYAGSLKTMREMRQYRISQADSGPMHWWGDVYKLIPFIHDYLPALDYRTAIHGKKQTIVAPSKSTASRDVFFSEMLQIANLQFSDLEKCTELWKFYEESELDVFVANLKK